METQTSRDMLEAKRKNSLLSVNSINLEDTNSVEWEHEDWDDNSTNEEGPMSQQLRGELCNILYRIRRGTFKQSLTKILALPLTISNIQVFAWIIHDTVTSYPHLAEDLANLSDAMFRKLPTEIGTKMRNFLMERCDSQLMCPHVDPDTRAIMRDLELAATSAQREMLQGVYNQQQKQRERCVNNARFIGELWKAGSLQTERIRIYIRKLFMDCNDLSMKCFHALLKTVAKQLEESNEDLSYYFDMLQEICKADHLSTQVKHDLLSLDELRYKKWNRYLY
jgi:hypothetical protein